MGRMIFKLVTAFTVFVMPITMIAQNEIEWPYLKSEYAFGAVFLKVQPETEESDEQRTVVYRSDATVWVENNKTLLILIMLIPVGVIRFAWNVSTWNKIYKTHYLPVSSLKKGEDNVHLYCFIIFWWLKSKGDTTVVRRYKRIGNWISAVSVIILGVGATLLRMYGE
jgi:hypothetical protein